MNQRARKDHRGAAFYDALGNVIRTHEHKGDFKE